MRANFRIKIFNYTLNISKEYNASGQGGDFIRIDNTEKLYIVNIHTNQLGMPIGPYVINTTFSNNISEIIGFNLVDKSGNGKGKGKNL